MRARCRDVESELTNPRIRKVKCDESKPACLRCTSTGRKCDGYPASPEQGLTWYRPSHLFQSIDQPVEGRALQFFCENAGPLLSGPLDPYFWTHLVIQFSNFEPSVRHSVVAISSLYEDYHCRARTVAQLRNNDFALRHYNAAIENLRKLNNEPLILLVCVLFVCIELLQGNRDAAMQHIRHGIIILERIGASYPWTVEHLAPVFRRLSVFPLFFGSSVDTFPRPAGLDAPIPARFTTFSEAQYYMDAIICQASRLIRHGDPYRYGKLLNQPVDPRLLAWQLNLELSVNDWYDSMADLNERLGLKEEQDTAYCNAMLRYRLARSWARSAFEPNETAYDERLDDLKAIIDRAVQHSHRVPRIGSNGPRFTFEVGFVPFVIYATMHCRDLRTRLRGLIWLRECGTTRENLWEPERMYPICKRLVEIEHNIVLDKLDQPVGPVAWEQLPIEEMRSKDFSSSPDRVLHVDADGRKVWGSWANFVMRTREGKVWMLKEFLPRPASVGDVLEE
ncbi:hypothetical protein JX265_013916 [Neoarthrinium moseri]|uniref:Ig-like domain-containing protein n=1 Tax=Neoarthrinium moseri TaxID=1658444 RepID=A0A9P9W7R6_9PEZI|nr:hypothetical protein JX265_013916 [Neoarthrinium moseri]